MDHPQDGHAAEHDGGRQGGERNRAADLELGVDQYFVEPRDDQRVDAGEGQCHHAEFQRAREGQAARQEAEEESGGHEGAVADGGRAEQPFEARGCDKCDRAQARQTEGPCRVADEAPQPEVGTEKGGDRERHRPGRRELGQFDAAALLHTPQADRAAGDDCPEDPDRVMPRGEREGERQRRPEREELPGVGAAGVGLADQGE